MFNYENNFRSYRSNGMGFNGMVATSQPLGAQAGLEILRQGGNAIDAALATIATMCVVEPCSTGIGGDAFALIWIEKEKQLYGLNASGPSPIGLTADKIRADGHDTFPALGGQAVTVPGSLRGWELASERFGKLGLDTILKRPIHYASQGFPVSELISKQWGRSQEKMSRLPDSKRVWFPYPGGRGPKPAERFQNVEFAKTLQKIAEEGVEAFYTGETAAKIAKAVQDDNGYLTEEDLGTYRAEWVDPIRIEYRPGYHFYEIPPNGQGLTALIALNIVKQFDIPSMGHGSYTYLHTMMEAIKLAFADAAAYIADPRHADIPLEGLLSDQYAAERAKLIDAKSALSPFPGQPNVHGDTVYLTTADGDGNMVSWIQSLYMGFGSGITAADTGVQLQNRGANFSLVEGHPNEAAPRKRPYHTIIPGFITKDEEAFSSFGVMGGFMQPQGHLLVGSNLVDFKFSPQASLDAPRFNWQKDRLFALETAFGDAVYEEMRLRGHEIMPAHLARSLHYGGGQVIVKDPESGAFIGGSEPRADGAVAAY